MQQPIELKTQADFQSGIEEIVTKYAKGSLMFRGQTSDRPLIPSLLRGCVPKLTANWNVIAERIISQFRPSKHSQIETQAIMQHYGYRSLMIDVTSSPEVALWFALHRFTPVEQASFFVENELRSAVFQWTQYVSCQTGFMYLLKMPETHDYEYVDLMQTMPANAARVHRQKAGAIICARKPADALIVAKFKIVDNGWFSSSHLNIKTTELFPLPSVDDFYRKLCTIPYYIASRKGRPTIEIGHPLLGEFPIYAESSQELYAEYVPLTRILSQSHPAMKWKVATGTVEFERKRYKVRGAIRILLSRLMIDNISEAISENDIIQEKGFPSDNVVLEFEPEASLVTPSSEALQDVVRGLWIILGQNGVLIIEIVDNFKDVFLGREFIYSVPDLKSISKNRSYTDYGYYPSIIILLSKMLANGSLYLSRVDQFYWRISQSRAKRS